MSLIIEIAKDGRTTVSVDGVVVGLIKSIDLHVEVDEALPRVSVVMNSARELPVEVQAAHLRNVLEVYKRVLSAHPLIAVSEHHDTLPQGMPAVRPEE
jgi:hypothetical protein